MPKGFEKIRYQGEDARAGTRGLAPDAAAARGGPREAPARTFPTDEAAARFHLGRALSRDERPRMRGLASPERPQVMPEMRMRGTQPVPSSTDMLVTFDQTVSSIPIFGSRVAVQIDENRELVQIGGDMAHVDGVSPVATLSPIDALARIAALAEVDPAALKDVAPPALTFFHDDDDGTWHLAYLCANVPAAPPDLLKELAEDRGHGLGASPRQRHPRLHYLVDAHDGRVLFYYSAAPTIDIPSECFGDGETGSGLQFWGLKLADGFEMTDPRRSIRTYDMAGKDLSRDPVPAAAIKSTSSNWKSTNKAAVSAHVNATTVYNFYKSVLLRDGIDGKGMDLVSIVNVTYADDQPGPEWHNAVWYDDKMWYGQNLGPDGGLRSFSRFLDVIAHELTHGITEHTSNLVYKDQSGALNESFSDIFGIIIANWNPKDPDRDVSGWTWQLGAGLGEGGGPLRDLSNPRLTGDPDHMQDFLRTKRDSGGVHTNSNIHNKAAYNVLTAADAHGGRVFRPMEAAELFYLCLSRLSSRATFSDALQGLVDVAAVYYAGDEAKQGDRIQAIKDAYGKVGITVEGLVAPAPAFATT
jgi:bacillolysin/neutral peptidase B